MSETETAPTVELDNSERTECEIWTRCMGYHRPVNCFNAGKQSEHKERKLFKESSAANSQYCID